MLPAAKVFFVPGLRAGASQQDAYRRLSLSATQATGLTPSDVRISGLDCTLGGRAYRIEVGEPDPIQGHVVLAIFDVGGDRPYVIYTARDEETPAFRLGGAVIAQTAFR